MERIGDGSRTGQLSVSRVPPEHIDFVWAQVEPQIEKGLRHGAGDSMTKAHIRKSLQSGDYMMLAVHARLDVIAVIVFEVVQHPARRILFVVMVAGERFGEWAPLAKEVMWALREEFGCDGIQATVRDGFMKVLKEWGWVRKATLMEMVE